MKRAKRKINNYRNAVANSAVMNNRAMILNAILFAFGFLVLSYILLLSSVVSDVVSRKSLESKAYEINNEIGGLELEYLAISSRIDRDMSLGMGFEEIEQDFATRSTLTVAPESEYDTLLP